MNTETGILDEDPLREILRTMADEIGRRFDELLDEPTRD